MERAKLIDGVYTPAPRKIISQNTIYSPATEEALIREGWKEVIRDNYPTCEKGYHAEEYWTENETQLQLHYNIVEDSNAQKVADLRYWFDNYYREYNEKLTRFEALGITEEIYDDIRNITYTTLNDLYTEAEVVRAEINELENDLEEVDE